MKIAVLRERFEGESRVAATPETVAKFIALGAEVAVEEGAGTGSRISDDQFKDAGAAIGATAAATLKGADIVLCVRRPSAAELKGVNTDALLIGALDPYGNEKDVAALAKAGVVAMSMEFMPRITRAQVMDILSSQANLAGYQAVIEAAAVFDRAMPMMMTAAGTVRPAKAFVMGAGVAGLQAIATAKRLGAVVSATDVRAAAGEQVESLGGKFIMTEALKDASGTGGYARELTKDEQAAQAELVAGHISKQDIVVTTALIPGRPAPKLVTKAMVESMAPGSVIVDLAAERGGNVELTQPGKVITHNGVTIIGYTNLPGHIPTTASQLYARNLLAFITTLIDAKEKKLAINWEDELVKATVLTREGAVVHPNFAASKTDPASAAEARPAPARKPAAKKPATRKTSASKAAASKAAAAPKAEAGQPPADKPAPRKSTARKPAAKVAVAEAGTQTDPAAKAPTAKKPAARKPATRKPATKQPAVDKPAATEGGDK
ncbi:NAD(P) transhydrogenase subunit alpha [Devosia subaequoris]|uniref:NAD(P) transhydrogenase subunit alpha n=1 Tax=Devosia subaequoris TaxID=395930 RepID=A0A7W6NCA3_9HYPH|nr:Re/Si-specific NAD(P)(+) transhydrogenase subunit alpha [Devosia subaequoris]MBB4052708.1 NAD(P) transhydrogenase subunit alpha [Devosia subaequoris]MCP1209862.1 Re/Si-specific NAD(P)(+) transhydrogenase subunit alpha [Devosia subaequoris]